MGKRQVDQYQIEVKDENPHVVARDLAQQGSPFYPEENFYPSVSRHDIRDGKMVGGLVDVWADEHLSAEQQRYVEAHPNIKSIVHVWPGERSIEVGDED